MQQQSHNEQQRIQTAHQSAQRTIYDLTADDSNNDDDDDSVIWINSSPSGVDNNTHSFISQIPTSGNQLIRLNEQPTGLMAPIHADDDNEPPQQQQPTQTAQTVLSQQKLQQSIQLLDTRQLPATPQPQQQQLQDTSPANRLKRKRIPSQTAQRPNNTCKNNEYQQKRPAIKHTVSESELTPKKPCRYLASTWDLQLSQQRLQLGKRHHVDPAYADPPSPKRSRMQQQRHANKPACILIHYTSGKWFSLTGDRLIRLTTRQQRGICEQLQPTASNPASHGIQQHPQIQQQAPWGQQKQQQQSMAANPASYGLHEHPQIQQQAPWGQQKQQLQPTASNPASYGLHEHPQIQQQAPWGQQKQQQQSMAANPASYGLHEQATIHQDGQQSQQHHHQSTVATTASNGMAQQQPMRQTDQKDHQGQHQLSKVTIEAPPGQHQHLQIELPAHMGQQHKA
ncbi:putative mediator of RNA polymerase II transcription subunit 12, partial [Drosophila novamexicana]|uniref:putative mediator of RNA polymerase II transcription subunit 12 n=1 Tax=Drosophila novamexicana TaxID=47314 RepID=UPI0011E5CE1F